MPESAEATVWFAFAQARLTNSANKPRGRDHPYANYTHHDAPKFVACYDPKTRRKWYERTENVGADVLWRMTKQPKGMYA